jgi:uncharacterized protein (DUF1778 family)
MPNTGSRNRASKETRINVRINPVQKDVIARAARMGGITITDFVVTQAFQAASHLVAEETQLRMSPSQFDRFCKALDAPPAKSLKAMRKLLEEPSALDG